MLDDKTKKRLLDNAKAERLSGTTYVVKMAKPFSLGSVQFGARTPESAMAKFEEWLNNEGIESVVSSWRDPTAQKKK